MALNSSMVIWEEIERIKSAEQKRVLRWQLQAREPIHSFADVSPGDHLVKKSSIMNISYEHHFLCIGFNNKAKPKIIHYFNKAWYASVQFVPSSLGFVQEMTLPHGDFIKSEEELQTEGNEVERVVWPDELRRYSVVEVVERAMKRKGYKWYNCETFVMSCMCGLEISLQGSPMMKTTKLAAQQVLKSLVIPTRSKRDEDLSQVRTPSNGWEEIRQNVGLVQISRSLIDEIRLREMKERERDKKITVDEIQSSLRDERRTRTAVEQELNRARIVSTELRERWRNDQRISQSRERELQTKENVIPEQQRRLEEEQQEMAALAERLRSLELRMEEERNRSLSTERQSAVSAADEALVQSRDWIIHREEIVLTENFLGRGAWGIVREGRFRGCQVAVKEIYEVILSDHNRRRFEREMTIASLCRHPNLLQFIGATNDNGEPLFVTELLDTSLRHVLSQRALTHEETLCLALDIAKGLNYLHLKKPRPIIHRDISSANVLLWRRDQSWRAKLSDYGAANFMREYMTEKPGAVIYAAPEAFTHQQSPKVDVYSFGVLLCEMCIREQPDPQELHNQLGRVSGPLRGLIQQCVEKDPDARPTMSEVICDLEQFL